MRRYGGKRRSDLYAPYGRCPTCGWAGKDWGFNYHRSCTTCYNAWRKARAEERRKRRPPRPPNENITVAEGIVVTRNVRNRLKKQAHREFPPTTEERLWALGAALVMLALFVVGFALLFSLLPHGHLENAVLFGICGAGLYGVFRVCERKHAIEVEKRQSEADARLEELARDRQRQIDEASAFYTSSEWRLVRTRVVQEQGRICQKCRSHIRDDYDLTVDHIKPRSKFPELALEISNLQVLCRKCNSAKGATYNEASITAQASTPSSPPDTP